MTTTFMAKVDLNVLGNNIQSAIVILRKSAINKVKKGLPAS